MTVFIGVPERLLCDLVGEGVGRAVEGDGGQGKGWGGRGRGQGKQESSLIKRKTGGEGRPAGEATGVPVE